MSRGRSSDYPERPQGGKRPPQPGVKRNKPSSEHISGRRKMWLERPKVEDKLAGDRLDGNLCVIGHSNTALVRFLKQHRHNKVPLRQWGGRSTLYA
jgi:hypothetical protein